ncbi:MAG: phosphoenolpyruvate synthase [Pseudomonadales bacterium]|jgi:pyruvate,water dikinase|nr:phosphoenolpyruvate synthase [Pseudomonadales bacterium]
MTNVLRLEDLGIADVARVGGKNAALGELHAILRAEKLRVPGGFAVTAEAFRAVLAHAGLEPELRAALEGLDPEDPADLAVRARACRELLRDAPWPEGLAADVLAAYGALEARLGEGVPVAVRSSATAEDLPEASFAGQHDSFLNVSGGEALVEAVRACMASLFNDRAIRYRENAGFDHFDVALSVGVMQMVRSDLAASGVAFSIDTESGFPDVVFVTAAYGLGEAIVQGDVDPDEFYVHKPTFEAGHRRVLRRRLGAKASKVVWKQPPEIGVRSVAVASTERNRYCVDDAVVLEVAEAVIRIERHFSQRAGRQVPMDVEWAVDGVDGEVYIVQARPETVVSQRRSNVLRQARLTERGEVRVSGRAVGNRIATGAVRVVRSAEDLRNFREGEVLVAEMTSPDWGTVLRRASALVTDRGGRTCHAAIVARELDVPAIVGCGDATAVLATGDAVTVCCAEGETGRIYDGALAFETEEIELGDLPRPRTQMMLNLGNPDIAFKTAMLPSDGVGLARLEFIITDAVKLHPMAALHPERLDPAVRREIEQLTRSCASPADFFVRTLAEGIGTIAAAFHPRPVVVRLSDFKSNEYAELLGGSVFEPEEENPMLGFRGASRYASPSYREAFELECRALKEVREGMGLDNVRVMVPFCRRVPEAEQVIAVMAEQGLVRGEHGLEVFVMCEIPNNVILIDEFAKHFDGFSIGSNDLTQLTLGGDRDSEMVAFDFDERDPGVLRMLAMAVEGARRNGRHVGICGQAPSDYPEVAEFLVRAGIDAISLNPDTLLPTTLRVLEVERSLATEGDDSSAEAGP